MSELESVIRRLEGLDHRITPSRVAVIAAVLSHSGHFSVDDIVRQARAVGRATVFRTMRLLTGDEVYDAGSFESWNGVGQLSMDLADIPERAVAIGISIEDAGAGEEPGEMFLFAKLPQE